MKPMSDSCSLQLPKAYVILSMSKFSIVNFLINKDIL